MRSRTFIAVMSGVLVVAGFVLAGPQAASAATSSAVPKPDHVVVVVEENKAQTQIVGNPAAPYITSLAAGGANFTSSFAITHPSQPNYVALFSGSTQGLTDDSCPHSYSTPSLGDQLLAGGHTFAGYSEGLPSAGYTGCSSGSYARKHNPWTDFPAIPASANQPFSAFPTDYSTLPDVSFVIPNLADDMHDGTVAQGDTWLQSNLGGYVDWAKTHNSLLILTFDEDDGSAANRIATVFSGQSVVPGQYGETINHYNVLRTIEDAYGLAPLGASATASPITDVWTGNRPPTASFTLSCPTLACAFDGSGSADPDGTIAGYAWDFGDGTTGSGVGPSHTYAASGQYPVTLTVTDDQGATSSAQHTVVVGSTPPFVLDSFNRTVSGGLGRADVGGAWTTSGAATSFGVTPGAATITMPKAGATLSGFLPSTVRTDADLVTQLSLTAVPVGGPVYLTVEGRRVSSGNEYSAKVLVNADRSVTIRLIRFLGGTETILAGPIKVAGLTYVAGAALDVRLQVAGTAPAQLRARGWLDSTAEPATWQVTATDSSAALQQPGAVGLVSYLSSAATNAPIAVNIAKLSAQPTGATNAPPTAAFTTTCTQLDCTFDGTGSNDPGGAIANWSWDLGDGVTATGASVEHAYAVAGTYSVTLTVTDGQGAVGTVTHAATATAPPVNQPPVAAFTSACTALSCTFDGTGSTDDEGVAGWSWSFGDGSTGTGATATHTFAAGTYQVALTVTDTDAATGSVTHSVTVSTSAPAFAADAFNRTVASGFGTADVGGAWALVGPASYGSVTPGHASIRLPQAAAQLGAYLPGATRTDADLTTSFTLSAVPVGGPLYLTFSGRRVSSGNEYAAKLLVNADKTVTIRLIRILGGTETIIAGPLTVAGLTYVAGATVAVRLQVTGTGPTRLRARAWPADAAEPATWPVTATDSTAALQVAGGVGLLAYLSGAATNAPLTVSFGPLTARPTAG